MEKFIIVEDYCRNVRRFGVQGRTIKFKLKPVPEGEEPISWVKEGVQQIFYKCLEDLEPEPDDQVGLKFGCSNFQKGEGWINFQAAKNLTVQNIWDMISSVHQSNSNSDFNTDIFYFGVTSVRPPVGRGKGKQYNNYEEECAMRKGIICITNEDNLCLPRALVVAQAYATQSPDLTKIRRNIGKRQDQEVQRLLLDSGVIIPAEGAGVNELQQLQTHLGEFRITVYVYGTKGKSVMFQGPEATKTLNLIHHRDHYNVIRSLTAAFCCGYFCEVCHVPYNSKNAHHCGSTCPACLESPVCSKDELTVVCGLCKRSFRGQLCLQKHLQSTVCKTIRRCTNCFKTVRANREHICGERYCTICSKHQPSNHLCYIQKDLGKPKENNLLFIFYDFETQQKLLDDQSHLHQPNLCVFKQCCDRCMETDDENCVKCGVRLQILKTSDPVSPFIHHLLTLRKKFKQVVVVAHNGGGFDHQFLLNYIITKTDLKPELILRGTRLIMMTLENVKFLDSLNYFPMALEVLPKAFALGEEIKKGYFPHLFNIPENATFVGRLPAMHYYNPDGMKPDKRQKFLEWYQNHKGDQFIMEQELTDYCISDVDILTKACLKFRREMIENANVDPFTEACTIASTCNKVYRRNYMKSNTIGVIPKNGYRNGDNQSKIGLQWLVWEEHQRGISIIHAGRGREAKVQGVKVDGLSDDQEIFEFHGCYFHGCPKCFKHQRDEPLKNIPSETLNLRYENTTAKTERLRGFGHEVVEMWECDFRKQLAENKEMRHFTEQHPMVSLKPLNPRDAFYGGRTGNTCEYYKCNDMEKIKYVDVCSLYPYVCKYGKFPVGHPQVYVGEECNSLNLQEVDGLIKCEIVPPRDLYHPVLPEKINGKLLFALCHTCCLEQQHRECSHNDKERSLTGTWVIDEIVKALEKGYKISKIHEVWKYKTETFDRTTKSGGLFSDMINKFLKIKQEASGWPKTCTSEEQKDQYLQRYFEHEKIKLQASEIEINPGLRSLAKLMLTSFWGKFGQRENQTKTKIINQPDEVYSLVFNPCLNVNSLLIVNEETLLVGYNHVEEDYNELTPVNVVIASYVTAQARLKLYSYLEQVEERVLYYDTDSVIYISRPNATDVPTGEYLGEMTDELESFGEGSYITEFVSGGPKNYAFEIQTNGQNGDADKKVVCKVKGISLNYTATKLINFETIKKAVLEQSEPIYVMSENICRNKLHEVLTKRQSKMYRPNSTKRKFFEDHTSLPYGHKIPKLK